MPRCGPMRHAVCAQLALPMQLCLWSFLKLTLASGVVFQSFKGHWKGGLLLSSLSAGAPENLSVGVHRHVGVSYLQH